MEPAVSKSRASAIVFAGGRVLLSPRLKRRLAEMTQPYIVAADAGARTALALDMSPDVVVGDLDSMDAATLGRLQSDGVPIERHPRDKNATDGELAIERAVRSGAQELRLVGFLGGPRLDQELASILLLARLPVDAVLLDGANECRVLGAAQAVNWRPEPSEIVSLIPLETVTGARTLGLRWPLDGETLERGTTRGVSNEPAADAVRVEIDSGLLLVCRYFADADAH